MGLLDSNKVGQLTKIISFTAEANTSDYIGNGIDLSGYNLMSFKVVVNSGSLDGTSSYLRLMTQTAGTSDYSPVATYKRNTNGTFLHSTSEKFTNGFYVTEDLSPFARGKFYITTSNAVSVTIEYVLSNGTFQDKINEWGLNSINGIVTEIKEDAVVPREQLIKTFENIDLSSTGANTFTLSGINKKYNALRINVVFNQSDDNATLYVAHTKGSNSTATGFQQDILIREDGVYKTTFKASEGLRYDFYLKGIPKVLNIRKDIAGASGLTATIKVYACTCEDIPLVKHIQPVFSRTLVAADSGQDIVYTFGELMKMYKFFFCVVGTANQSKTGTVSKNYVTSEEDDSDTILQFTSKTIATSKWLPVTVTSGAKITFNVTGARANTDKVEIYGVV